MDCILILLSRIYYSSVRFSQFFSTVFIARQAQHTTRNIDIVFLSVCLSVRLSVRCVPVFHGKAVASIFVRGNSPSLTLPFPSHRSPHLPSPPSPPLPFPPPSRVAPPPLPTRGSGGALQTYFWAFLRLRNVSDGRNFASLLCTANDKVHANRGLLIKNNLLTFRRGVDPVTPPLNTALFYGNGLTYCHSFFFTTR